MQRTILRRLGAGEERKGFHVDARSRTFHQQT